MCHISSIHSSVDGYLSCFCILSVENNAKMIMWVQISPWYSVVLVFGCISRNGVGGSYGNSAFNFLGEPSCSFWLNSMEITSKNILESQSVGEIRVEPSGRRTQNGKWSRLVFLKGGLFCYPCSQEALANICSIFCLSQSCMPEQLLSLLQCARHPHNRKLSGPKCQGVTTERF